MSEKLLHIQNMIYTEKCETDILMAIIMESADETVFAKIGKFCTAIIKTIHDLIVRAVDAIKKFFTTTVVKNAINEFESEIQENPELKNEKFEVFDIDKHEKLIDETREKIVKTDNIEKTVDEYNRKRNIIIGASGGAALVTLSGAALLIGIKKFYKNVFRRLDAEYAVNKKNIDRIGKEAVEASKKHKQDYDNYFMTIQRYGRNIHGEIKYNQIEKMKALDAMAELQYYEDSYQNAIEKQKTLVQLQKDSINGKNFFIKWIFKLLKITKEMKLRESQFENDTKKNGIPYDKNNVPSLDSWGNEYDALNRRGAKLDHRLEQIKKRQKEELDDEKLYKTWGL